MSAAKKPTHVVEDELALDDFVKRIRRAEGQMGGILRMVEEGRSCEDIVNQLAAVSKAIDKTIPIRIRIVMPEAVLYSYVTW